MVGVPVAEGGLDEAELPELVEYCGGLEYIRLRGLMGMPPWCDDPELVRPHFRRLRELADKHNLAEVSMGMSHDLEAAVQEGSTLVRVGTAIFGKRNYNK